MNRENSRKLRAATGGPEKAFQSDSLQTKVIANGRGRFLAIRGGLDIQEDIATDNNIQYLQRLEAENAELRNTAVQLALEVRTLRRLQR